MHSHNLILEGTRFLRQVGEAGSNSSLILMHCAALNTVGGYAALVMNTTVRG